MFEVLFASRRTPSVSRGLESEEKKEWNEKLTLFVVSLCRIMWRPFCSAI